MNIPHTNNQETNLTIGEEVIIRGESFKFIGVDYTQVFPELEFENNLNSWGINKTHLNCIKRLNNEPVIFNPKEIIKEEKPKEEPKQKLSKEESFNKMNFAKEEKILNKKFNYGIGYGVLTRKEFIKRLLEEGGEPIKKQVDNKDRYIIKHINKNYNDVITKTEYKLALGLLNKKI